MESVLSSVSNLFRLSPILPLPVGIGTIPKSLEPLLQEGSDISWNSEFVTPVANSVTRSSLNSTERKVLMPTSSSRNVSYKIKVSDVIRIVKHLCNKSRLL